MTEERDYNPSAPSLLDMASSSWDESTGLGAALSVKTEFNGPKLVTRTDIRD